ncbi:MAG: nodulation protein NfeD [Calditrichaeota bacterium]|nr:nodulation protein NfeD [Calditrichota bacterium]
MFKFKFKLLSAALLALVFSNADCAEIHRVRIDGVINPVSSKFIIDAVDRAETEKAAALLIELDTPGGLLEATRDIVQRFLAADVPVIVYVSPDGARAGSAGVFITLAAHIAAMAPGTNIGAAHPVSIGGKGFPGGGEMDSANARALSDKATNDAAALCRSIAQTRHRNVEWAEKAVRESASITALDALEHKVIDILAPSVDSLLSAANGRKVHLKSGETTLQSQGVALRTFEMTWREKFFDKISDPNLAYIFMMIGIYGIMFELYNPGAVLPGVLGGIGILLALFAFQALPVNATGVLLIIFGIILLLLEIKVTSYGVLTVGGAVSLFLGSFMLFDTDVTVFRVSLGVIIPVVIFTLLFFLFAIGMGLRAQARRVETGREALIGQSGEALSEINPRGMVLVEGEYWNAECAAPEGIPKGAKVVVREIKGMTLVVDKV